MGDYSQEPLSYCRLKWRCLKPYLIHPLNGFYATEFKRRNDITCWEQNVQHLSSMKILHIIWWQYNMKTINAILLFLTFQWVFGCQVLALLGAPDLETLQRYQRQIRINKPVNCRVGNCDLIKNIRLLLQNCFRHIIADILLTNDIWLW